MGFLIEIQLENVNWEIWDWDPSPVRTLFVDSRVDN